MTDLYPFKFSPIYKQKIWGGTRIGSVLGKDISSLENCGESWELSAVEGNVSIISNGNFKGERLDSMIQKFPTEILGAHQAGHSFPLLIKFLDANDDLSIQVHPDDQMAERKYSGKGKTEMWYIIDSEPGSKMYVGFKEKLTKEEFLEIGGSSEILNKVCQEETQKGDVFYVPAGRIHSIGKGILLAEIQQTSDFTYRIYDFDRTENGKPRDLHIDDAAEALNYDDVGSSFKTDYNNNLPYTQLVESPYFNTWRISGENKLRVELNNGSSFRIYIVINGRGKIYWQNRDFDLTKGDVVLVPACLRSYSLDTDQAFSGLEVFIS